MKDATKDPLGTSGKWSVEDMFKTNARILGVNFTYDGNPHTFGDFDKEKPLPVGGYDVMSGGTFGGGGGGARGGVVVPKKAPLQPKKVKSPQPPPAKPKAPKKPASKPPKTSSAPTATTQRHHVAGKPFAFSSKDDILDALGTTE